ncbi:DUF4065 domain-containing protein [Patescibacteria group bacterium]|nr:DUF4065 domain-containing protein [Patescibacteria group bacterium]
MIPNLKKLRTDQNLSQAFLAEKLGVSRPTYIQIENGKRELNSSEIRKLTELYDIPPENFIFFNINKLTTFKVSIKKSKKLKKKLKQEIRISVPQEKVNIFKEIFLYILEKVGSKPNVGETVLYKLLYFIDFNYYEKYEEQLMGATYIKKQRGPAPVVFKKVIKQMQEKKEIEPIRSKFFQYDQKKYLPLRKPNLDGLSARDIQHIDEVLDNLSNKTGKELSDYSHKDVPWITAKDGQIIDYEAVFYRNDDTSVREYKDEL